ncbi:MAG: hypothetical protein JXN65_03350 [Clostridia bacterium]|nr:hypothetical protein [Clostridia bacterium]
MKKILVVLLILAVLSSVFAGAALADPGKNADKQQEKKEELAEKKEAREVEKAEREEQREEWKSDFEANKLERTELRLATKEQIKEQRQLVAEYKEQLRVLRQEIENLPEEEQALYAEQLEQLRTQVKDAQGYVLQIRKEGQDAKFQLSPSYVTPAQRPVPEVEVVDEVIEEVFDDLAGEE